ncbi:hypothetical protein NG798_26960 [Ancylothrix sp. C2]|uniref:hypothetical protein n=1 Tax=Ancylothrix sp. D3o TaxID=2953691 RepID=UPI0021BA7BC9|nr:hypothetical protein [Ancylothrix sp. D3o]MCT7953445.1 hypothetical protein [Ancylothrix sp. D3o]
MSDSILDKIRSNRQRTVVPARVDTLIPTTIENEQAIQTESEQATQQESEQASLTVIQQIAPQETSQIESIITKTKQQSQQVAQQETPLRETLDSPATSNSTLEELKAQLALFNGTRRHSAIVLDTEIDSNLTRFCKEKGITVELFLEAAWLEAVVSEELMKKILTEAKRRYQGRKQAGKLRRLITMLSGNI